MAAIADPERLSLLQDGYANTALERAAKANPVLNARHTTAIA